MILTQTTEEQQAIIEKVGWDRIRINKAFCTYCTHYNFINGCKFNKLSTELTRERCIYFYPKRGRDKVEKMEDFYAKKEEKLNRKKLKSLL